MMKWNRATKRAVAKLAAMVGVGAVTAWMAMNDIPATTEFWDTALEKGLVLTSALFAVEAKDDVKRARDDKSLERQ